MPSMTLTCAICNLPMQKSRTSKTQGQAAHNACRTGGNHGKAGYRRGCRCDTCRNGQRIAMADYYAQRKARDGISHVTQARRKARGIDPTGSRECFLCKTPLERVPTGTARYPLHKKCRDVAPNWIRRGHDNPARAIFQAKIDKAAAGTSGGGRVFVSGNCPWCGDHFVRVGKFCSRKCATAQKYADRSSSSFKISPKERLRIYERDRWVCQLCTHPVDPTRHYQDDWSATLDHIIPRSHMLVPDHSPSNLRLAHRWCNSARGDGSNMTEMKFRARIAELRSQAA